MELQRPRGRTYRRAGQTIRQALCRPDLGSSRWLEDRWQDFSERARSTDGRDSLAAVVGRILWIGGTWRRAFRPTGQYLRRSRPNRRVSEAGTERRVDYTAD